MPSAFTSEPHQGPKITPFIIASASVTENGADATTARMSTASGIANGPERAEQCSTCALRATTNAASANETNRIALASSRRSNKLGLHGQLSLRH